MKVYLVNPRFNPTIWSFEGLHTLTGTRFSTTPLGLATVASLTPKHWEIEIGDENVKPLNFDTDADLIGITSFNTQYHRALAIAGEFKRRGKAVVFGGPYCSLFPEAFEGKGAYRIVGEAEKIWPEFLNDFENQKAAEIYIAPQAKVDLAESPIPRYDLIRAEDYNMFTLQTSRGCPFQCEFCDIHVTDGHRPRTKTVEQVLAEVRHCMDQGAHYILFGDANFIGNIPFARKLLTALAEFSRSRNYPVEFCCELTLNVAQHPDLLELMQAANFYSVFIGIESPRPESLKEVKKAGKTREGILKAVEAIHAHHLSICAGMIVGFDNDDALIFQEQYEFLNELGIPFTTCGTLIALPNTALKSRLEKEGRMLAADWVEMDCHGTDDCNFIPAKMTNEELQTGYNWLIRCLYRYDTYGQRLVTLLSRFRNKTKEHPRVSLDAKFTWLVVKIFFFYLATTDFDRMKFFVKTFGRVAAGGPFSVGKWLEFFRWMATYPSFRKYVTETHGRPEGMDPKRPPVFAFKPDLRKEPARLAAV